MKLAYLPAYLMDKSPDMVLPSYLRLYPAEQACKNIAQNRPVVQLGNKTLSYWITLYWIVTLANNLELVELLSELRLDIHVVDIDGV